VNKISINIYNFNKNYNSKKTQKINTKNYFIGPWCLNPKNILKENYKDALNMYSPKKKIKFSKDVDYLIKSYDLILNLIYKNLNLVHNKNYSKQFWEILVARWLYTWINQVYFRWEYIKKIKKKYNIDKFFYTKDSLNNIVPESTEHAHHLSRTIPQWSESTFFKIMNFQSNLKTELIILNKNTTLKIDNKFDTIKYPKFAFYHNTNKIFFYNFELNLKAKIKIFKNLNIFSIKFIGKKKIFNKNDVLRENFNSLLPNSNKKKFNDFLIKNLKFNIPKIFLENFSQLEKIYLDSKWPTSPRYILTSYGQYYDEIFKLYVASHKMKYPKSKFCILQHGFGNFFHKNDYYNVYLDRKISDIYLSWGNLKKNNNYPFFYPRKSGSKINKFKFNKLKNILFLTYSFSGGLLNPPDGSKNGNIINLENSKKIGNLFDLVNSDISKKIFIKNLNINVYKNFEYSIRKKNNKIKFINENERFLKIEKNFNLFIHIFFGTCFFECMTLNKPSIIIYEKNIHHPFDKKFTSYIRRLEEEEILYYNEKKAANFLNKNYNNLEKWWNNKNLQNLRNEFCKDYCLYTNKEIEILKKNLKNI